MAGVAKKDDKTVAGGMKKAFKTPGEKEKGEGERGLWDQLWGGGNATDNISASIGKAVAKDRDKE